MLEPDKKLSKMDQLLMKVRQDKETMKKEMARRQKEIDDEKTAMALKC